jgi:hypothetical protein
MGRVPHEVDPATFPAITVAPDVTDWNHEIAGPGAQAIVLTLAENLELENQALLRKDPTILAVVDHGDRLDEMQERLRKADATGRAVTTRYLFDTLAMSLLEPFGVQTGLSLAVDAKGTMTQETHDATGAVVDRREVPFSRTFVMRRALGDRWLNVAVLPVGGDS